MTADWTRLPCDVLARISNRIANPVPEANRVVLDGPASRRQPSGGSNVAHLIGALFGWHVQGFWKRPYLVALAPRPVPRQARSARLKPTRELALAITVPTAAA